MDAPDVIVSKSTKQICDELLLQRGNQPTDGGNLLLDTLEKNSLISSEPLAEKYIRPFSMGNEFINNIERWCLWFEGISDVRRNYDLQQMPQVVKRIQNVQVMRLASKKAATQKKAAIPYLFDEIRQPNRGKYLAVPKVSSETRLFIPIGYLDSSIIAGDKLFMLPNAELYHFGILCSTMHNAFMRVVSGRLESRYSYSNTVVYNNFPFPFTRAEREAAAPAVQKHIAAIEQAAQQILDAREYYAAEARAEGLPEPSLADLYRADAGFAKLDQAHAALDKAVDAAYGYRGKNGEAGRVAFLFSRYRELCNAV
ncbi:MAG: DNA methyltransferase [Neisseria sp.]|nr:DNA methyltransferase [Neisseria sp.]